MTLTYDWLPPAHMETTPQPLEDADPFSFADAQTLLGSGSFEPNGWVLRDVRLIGVRRSGLFPRCEVGCLLLFEAADFDAFDGRYLPIASFMDEGVAVAFYEALVARMETISRHEAADFVKDQARTFGILDEWQPAGMLEYEAYEFSRDIAVNPEARWVRLRGGSPFAPHFDAANGMDVIRRTGHNTGVRRAG